MTNYDNCIQLKFACVYGFFYSTAWQVFIVTWSYNNIEFSLLLLGNKLNPKIVSQLLNTIEFTFYKDFCYTN